MTETIKDLTEIQFPKLGWTFHIDPTAFTVFGIRIQWYGLIITLGLALAVLYCFPKMKRFGIDADRAIDAILGGVIGGIIGARLYYVIFNWSDYKKDSFGATLKAVINTRNGGLAIYGGIIGAFAVGLLICKLRKIKMLPMLDISVLGFLIGQGVGRWGNFVNQEAFGCNTDSFLGMTGGRIQSTVMNGMQMGEELYASGMVMDWTKPVHPCFLYESLWCILGFVLLSTWSKRRKYDGQIFLMYLAWYGAERFFVEGLRADSLMIGSIRVSQALSAVIFAASIILLIVMGSKVKRDPESYVLYASTEESRQLIEESRRKAMGMKGADAYDRSEDDDDDIGILPDEDDDDQTEDKTGQEETGNESAETGNEASGDDAADENKQEDK
ncbi:MAG: prolipoprotein diacylglyceryl transferase [Ruminococcus sp.]|nr:prolipoprotein diacylglyceryl transferase [Ruminococcus sp.]